MNRYDIKEHIKKTAKLIRDSRSALKQDQREFPYKSQYSASNKLLALMREYRHFHIAASLLRGTPYEKIEQPREGNEPKWEIINAIMVEVSKDEMEKTLHNHAV